MQVYIETIEKMLSEQGLYGYVVMTSAGILVVSLLLCVASWARFRDWRIRMESAFEQERIQFSDNLNAAHQQIQQLETELANLADRIEQTERDKCEAQAGAERAVVLEQGIRQRNAQLHELLSAFAQDLGATAEPEARADASEQAEALWQQHEALVALFLNRLHNEESRRGELEQARLTDQALLQQKDLELTDLRATINAQSTALSLAEQDFTERLTQSESALANLHEKHQAYKKYADTLACGRMSAFDDLNVATQKIAQLETESAALQAKIIALETAEPQQSKPEPECPTEETGEPSEPKAAVEVEAVVDVAPEPEQAAVIETAPEEPATGEEPVKSTRPLLAKFVKAFKTDFGLNKSANVEEPTPDAQPIDDSAQPDETQPDQQAPQEEPSEQPEETGSAAIAGAETVDEVSETPVAEPGPSRFGLNAETLNKAMEKVGVVPGLKLQWPGIFNKPAQARDDAEPSATEEAVSETNAPFTDVAAEAPENATQPSKGFKLQWPGVFNKPTQETGNAEPSSAETAATEEPRAEAGAQLFGMNSELLNNAMAKAAQLPEGIKEQWSSLFNKTAPAVEPVESGIDTAAEQTEDEATAKSVQIPGALKNFYQKITGSTR